MSRFEKTVCLINQYGEIVFELEDDGGYYKLPEDAIESFILDVGDVYRVEEVEFEVD